MKGASRAIFQQSYAVTGVAAALLLQATMVMMMPRITLFQSAVLPLMKTSANGEMMSQIPRMTLAQLHPSCCRIPVRMIARIATAQPVATLFHIALGHWLNPSTKGEI